MRNRVKVGLGLVAAAALSACHIDATVDLFGDFQLTGTWTIDGQPGGTIRLLEPRFASDFPRSMSTHDIGLRDVIEALQITGRMPKIYLITVSAVELEPMTIHLSPPVQESVVQIVNKLQTLLWDWWRERNLASAAEAEEVLHAAV